MDKMLVAVFDSERRAYQGFTILKTLAEEGALEVYAMAVIAKDDQQGVSAKRAADPGPLGTVVSLFTRSLLGLLGGPAGVAAEAEAGTLGGVLHDLARVGVDQSFLTEVGKQLGPGSWAVVAEAWEDWTVPVDLRISAAGGTVLRQARSEVIDGQIERDVTALGAELAALRAGLVHAREEGQAKLGAMIDDARARLQAAQDRARAALDMAARESEAKVSLLQHTLSSGRAETAAKLEARIAETQYDYQRRSEKLHQVWELAKQALVR